MKRPESRDFLECGFGGWALYEAMEIDFEGGMTARGSIIHQRHSRSSNLRSTFVPRHPCSVKLVPSACRRLFLPRALCFPQTVAQCMPTACFSWDSVLHEPSPSHADAVFLRAQKAVQTPSPHQVSANGERCTIPPHAKLIDWYTFVGFKNSK